jgi:hypothetical protein
MNAVVRSTLFDLSAQRKRPNDPEELIFDKAYRTVARPFSHAVRQAQTKLRAEGMDASRLDEYTWHSNRHRFASRHVMAGAAVERLVPTGAVELARN